MNKIYRSIWNAASGTHVAVAETTRAKGRRGSTVLAAGAMAAALAGGAGTAQAALVNLCTGVSLPSSTVTGIVAGIAPVTSVVDSTISSALGLLGLGSLGLQTTLNYVATGAPLGLSVLDTNGNVLGSTNCNALIQPSTPKGISLGGNQITGLGDVTIADARGINSVAIGNGAITYSTADNANQIAIGPNAKVGADGTTDGVNSVAIGGNALATKDNSVALGGNASATALNSTAVGSNASATALNSTALGNNASATGANSSALGNNASATGTNSVALGDGSIADQANTVSVGSAGSERKITNVAPGAVNSTSTDAVNGSQLYGVDNSAVKYDNPANKLTVTLGGPLSTDGGVTNGTTITNVHQGALSSTSTDAVNGSQLYATNLQITNILNSDTMKYFHANSAKADSSASGADSVAAGGAAVASGAGSVAVGDNSQATQNGAIAVGQNSTASGVNSIAIGTGAVATGSVAVGAGASAGNGGAAFGDNASATAANSVALGTGSQATRAGMNGAMEKYSNVAVTSTEGAVSVGSAGNERQITNVAGGTAPTDAVNVRQLDAVVDMIHNNINYNIDNYVKDANAGTAGAMALASMPQASYAGKSMAAAGVATYQGQSALAVGVSTMSDNGRWVIKFGGSANTRGNAGASAGVGFNF